MARAPVRIDYLSHPLKAVQLEIQYHQLRREKREQAKTSPTTPNAAMVADYGADYLDYVARENRGGNPLVDLQGASYSRASPFVFDNISYY